MNEVFWAAGIVVAVAISLSGVVYVWVRALSEDLNKLSRDLPLDYMPRDQVNQKFADFQVGLHNHMSSMERRIFDRFDSLDKEVTRLYETMKNKADKD